MTGSIKNNKSGRIVIIALLVISITILHYRTDHLAFSIHVVFRELYLLPIILTGFWFGLYGGVAAALSVTALYLPFVLMLPEGISGHNFGNNRSQTTSNS